MKISKTKKQKRRERGLINPKFRPCPNCGKDISRGGHFAPPMLGEEGFFVCENDKVRGDSF